MARVNQSCLTADIWQSAVIPYLTDQRFNLANYGTRESGTKRWCRVNKTINIVKYLMH